MKNRRIRGGGPARRYFARLLDIGRFQGYRIGQVKWLLDHFELELNGPQGYSAVLVLEKRGSKEAPALAVGRNLKLWYRGHEVLPRWLAEHFISVIERIQPDLDELFSRFVALEGNTPLLSDRQSNVEDDSRLDTSPSPGKDSGPPEDPAPGTFSPENFYADFLALKLLELMPFEDIEASHPFVRISHSDLECLSFMPQEKPSNLFLVDFPWIENQRGEHNLPLKVAETTYCTELDENKVIMGCNEGVKDLLERVSAAHPERHIIFTNTCLPATTGEDIASLLRRARRQGKVTLTAHNRALTDFDDDMLAPLLTERRMEAERRIPEGDQSAVNLVGFPPGNARKDLSFLLERAGIRVNAFCLPEVDEDIIDRLPRAVANILLQANRFWEPFFEQLSNRSRLRQIRPPLPYGIHSSARWLEAVCRSVGKSVDGMQIVLEHLGDRYDEFLRVRESCKEVGVVVVARRRDLEALEDGRFTGGMELLRFLLEMGFQIELFTEETGGWLPESLRELVNGEEPVTWKTFTSATQMRRLLWKSSSRLVLSNYSMDWRVYEAGKNRFSTSHLELGPEGALRTQRLLVKLAHVPFFQKLGVRLRRDGRGRLCRT